MRLTFSGRLLHDHFFYKSKNTGVTHVSCEERVCILSASTGFHVT